MATPSEYPSCHMRVPEPTTPRISRSHAISYTPNALEHVRVRPAYSFCRQLKSPNRMQSTPSPPSPSQAAALRVSLACVPCRSRHVRCDGKRPQCKRCSSEGKWCIYEQSRRGGLTRAALAARRDASTSQRRRPTSTHVDLESSRSQTSSMTNAAPDLSVLDGFSSQTAFERSLDPGDISLSNDDTTASTPSLTASGDPLLDVYYKYFHRLHPFVPPQRHLARLLADPANQMKLKPLVAMMKFIGSLYAECENSHELKATAAAARIERQRCSPKPDAFTVQCHLLSSMALYWFGEESQSREEMTSGVNLALELGMHDRHFAGANGCGDAVLQESWRRTWWSLFVIDAFYAAMTHVTTFPTCEVEATTELPCEEEEYESGV